jgi:nicotinate-nucleotide pyrophosphorylase (carboxylating)
MKQDIADKVETREIVRRALREDIGRGDVTSLAVVAPSTKGRALLYPRQPCVLAGVTVAAQVFRQADRRLNVRVLARDGMKVRREQPVLEIAGCARSILAAERVALNFVQRMSGIATLTAEYVKRARGATVLDTRKTTPTLRRLEKYAVTCGGGANHRFGLFDRVLIKDNHRALWAQQGGGTLADAVRAARRKYPDLCVEVEVETREQLEDVLRAKPDWVLLDNMPLNQIKECVAYCRGRCKVEVSGGVNLHTIAAIAATGVDAISVGALTHSAPAVDFTLEWINRA